MLDLAASLVNAEGGPFDLINGIPVHPLVVHAAVVLVPLTALGLLVMAFSRRFSAKFGWLVVLSSIGATVVCFVAKQAGEALQERVGTPGFRHADLGTLMPWFATGLLAATVFLWVVDRRSGADAGDRRVLRLVAAILAVVVAVGNLVWIYRVGDSGARSVWSGRVATTTSATP